MARKTPDPAPAPAEPAPGHAPSGQSYCAVTRLPGAPPRRAGRTWPEGQSVQADLTPAEIALIQADPRYTIAVLGEVSAVEADLAV